MAYRHWTFIDDEIEFTEASYMMCRRLNPKIPDPSSRKKSAEPTMLNSLGHRCVVARFSCSHLHRAASVSALILGWMMSLQIWDWAA